MALSNYGRDFYAELIVGRQSAPPSLYITFTTNVPDATSTGADLVEPGERMLLVPGVGAWSDPLSGVCTYTGLLQITTTWEDYWGTLVGYAICDSITIGTGNVLFYGTIPPVVVDGSASLLYLDIQGIEVGVS